MSIWTDYITFISHVLKVNEYGGRQTKVNEKRQCFEGWETLVNEANLFPEINKSLVISDDGSGNPIAIMPNGEVVLFDYDTEEKQVLSNSFEEFIEENFVEW